MIKFSRVILISVIMLVTFGCSGWYGTPTVAPETQGPCPVVGTWQGIIPGGIMAGRVVTFVFDANGTANGSVSTISIDSNYARTGNSFEITDIQATPAIAACPATQVGRYSIEFNSSCSSIQVQGADDPCNHRRLTLSGLRAERR